MKICIRCGKEFPRKDSLNRHLNNKKTCIVKYMDVDCNEIIKNYKIYHKYFLSKFQSSLAGVCETFDKNTKNICESMAKVEAVISCNFCGTEFKHKNNYYTHKKKYCKRIKLVEENDRKMKKLYELLVREKEEKEELEKKSQNEISKLQQVIKEVDEQRKEDIAKLQKELGILRQQLGSNNPSMEYSNNNAPTSNHSYNASNSYNTTTTNTNSNNVTNNLIININDYGKEDYSQITEEECKQLIEHDFNIILKFVELIHIDNPENMNIYIASLKEKYAMILKNQEWTAVNRVEFVKKLMVEKSQILCDLIKKYESKIANSKIDRVKSIMRVTLSDEEGCKKLTEDLELLFYNNNTKIRKNYETRYNKIMKAR